MIFRTILMWVSLGGLVVLLAALAVVWCNERQVFPFRSLLVKFRSLPLFVQVGLGLMVVHLVVYGSTKGTTNAPPSNMMGLMAPRPSTGFSSGQIAAGAAIVRTGTGENWNFSPPEGATVAERWRLRGAANERLGLSCEHPAEGAMAIDTYGRIATAARVYSPLGLQLGMVPEANWHLLGTNMQSLAWWMVTASNTTVVTWQNALLFRETNLPVSVQAEFFDDGRFVYRYDLASIGAAASNVFARVMTAAGADGMALEEGVTSVCGHLLDPEDGSVLDKDGDGISTHDEIFVYGTDPELPDTDGDGIPDGEEIANGTDPLAGDVPDAQIVARISAGATNETHTLVAGELESTKLWDGFALHDDPGTEVLYSRTFVIDRKGGWTSYFISSRGEEWRTGGEDMIGEWSLIGCELEWVDDTGASGIATASPRNDTLYLPLGTNATSVTISLKARALGTASVQQQGDVGTTSGQQQVGAGRRASAAPIFLLEYSPKLEFPGGEEIEGDDGNTYCVFTDPDDLAFTVDDSNRPCRAAAVAGEATAADFALPSEPGVYKLPSGERADEDVSPNQDAGPLMMGALMSPPNGNGDRYLVVIDPWVTYGVAHYGCCHEYPYDWGWIGYWCDCEPECGCGVTGYAAVDAYIDSYDSFSALGVVTVGGVTVWSDEAYHVVWGCDHDYDEPDGYCPCGCDGDCPHCSCCRTDGPSQGSIRFRVGLGETSDEQSAGFVWFESDGPVMVTPQIFEVTSNPNADVSVTRSAGSVVVSAQCTDGRDVSISMVAGGVSVAVRHHGSSWPYQTWEISNVSNLASVVRLVKRDLEDDVLEDWTYTCCWANGEWVWDVTDNVDRTYSHSEAWVEVVDGTNWVCGANGRLERLSVGTNDEEVVVRTFGYDADGRLALVDDGTNGCVTIAYDESGNISEMTGPEGTLRAAWDEDGVMTNLDTSAWNGSIPTPPPPLMMAAGPGLLGAPNGGDTIGPGEALLHFLDGTGTPMSMPFSEVNTSWLTPTDFACVRSFIQDCHWPGSYWVSGTRVIATDRRQQYFLGHITVQLEGWITYLGNCNWTFDGTMWGLDDTYDFNAAMRSRVGEALTSIGRWLFSGSGKPFTISFTGSKSLTGSGHCRD